MLFNYNKTTAAIVKQMEAENTALTSKILLDLIAGHSKEHEKYRDYFKRWDARGLPIGAKLKRDDGIDNKLFNDYRGEIVDTHTGYVFGTPISYLYNEKQADKIKPAFEDFLETNKMTKQISELATFMSVCGKAGQVLYIGADKKMHTYVVPPWECIWVKDQSTYEVQFGIRYYNVERITEAGTMTILKAEVYYNNRVEIYIQNTTSIFELESVTAHVFEVVNLLEYRNDMLGNNDFGKVESLIDGYDMGESLAQDEMQSIRSALLAFIGGKIDESMTLEKLWTKGYLEIPEGVEAKYLIKSIDPDFINSQLDRLDKNIYKFARSINFNDKEFTDASGIAKKWRMLALENRAASKEIYFREAFDSLIGAFIRFNKFKTVTGSSDVKKVITYTMKRSLPIDYETEAKTQVALLGTVSDETRLGLATFVPNAKDEIQRMDDEAQAQGTDLFKTETEKV